MTKIIISSLIVLLTTLTSVAQKQMIKRDNLPNEITQKCHEIAIYKLFPTENIWTFIKLNTRNGKMWQVQWSQEFENRLTLPIN